MRIKLLIIVAAILIILVGIVLYVLYGTSPTLAPETSMPATLPSASTTISNTGTTLLLGQAGVTSSSTGGTTIGTLDFVDASTTTEDPANPGLYHLGAVPSASSSPPYDITYESATQYFNISLLAEPIGQTRIAMQNDLMAKLGITATAMCRLNYMVSVPYWVNSYYTGESLGFSFCPGATELPN